VGVTGEHRSDLDLTGRVVIVTGGGTGIGAASARLMAEHGASLVLAGRTEARLETVAAELRDRTGTAALSVSTDVKVEQDVVRLVARTVEAFGRIDVVVNNAGGTRMMPVQDVPTHLWDSVFALNARGPFLLTREAGRHMIEQGRGVFVNISSSAGMHGVIGASAYGAAKSGLQMFTRIVAAEWGRFGIRANCLAVGLIASENAKEAWRAARLDVTALAAHVPLRRVGQPEEVASVVHFLASDASSYVSGQTFSANGGELMSGIPLED
jgi:citronellol/citronellal dehydrogenase